MIFFHLLAFMSLLSPCLPHAAVPEDIRTLLTSNQCRNCDLRYAHLAGENLSGADLRGADLTGANLSGANLSGADLRGALLSGAQLSGANCSNIETDGATVMPLCDGAMESPE